MGLKLQKISFGFINWVKRFLGSWRRYKGEKKARFTRGHLVISLAFAFERQMLAFSRAAATKDIKGPDSRVIGSAALVSFFHLKTLESSDCFIFARLVLH